MTRTRKLATRLATVAAAASSAVLVAAGPAFAADDSFGANTGWQSDGGRCGNITFIDHGEGWPGGGSNDDYFTVSDYCGGYGAYARVWVNGTYKGSKFVNGATNVLWDPVGNVTGGQKISVEICMASNSGGANASLCTIASKTIDG